MSTKHTLQNKKDLLANLNRSVMLTRFKLSQQKRQLREKDRRMTHITQLLKGPHLTVKDTDDNTHPKTSPKLNKCCLKSPVKPSRKEKQSQTKKSQNGEFHPDKTKRNMVAKKIVLKPKHEFKIIGSTKGGNKRKLNLQQKGIRSPPPKRHKSGHKFCTSAFNSICAIADRSQSPLYSELGFEEVIRMADENQNLDDEDLLEILTCPSPVWWEDPPDDGYMEDPIMRSPKPNMSLLKQSIRKTPRKKTPYKIKLELPESKNDEVEKNKVDVGAIVDTDTFNNISKSSDKFKNKRIKLENLLSTIKNKLSDTNTKQDCDIKLPEAPAKSNVENNDCKDSKGLEIDRNSPPESTRNQILVNMEDGSFPHISPQDNDSLKHLENIQIPVERKKDEFSSQTAECANVKLPSGFISLKRNFINPSDHLKVFKNDLSKSIPRYVKNKNLKIINIKKVPANLVSQISDQNMKDVSTLLTPKENPKSVQDLETDTGPDNLDSNKMCLQHFEDNETDKETCMKEELLNSTETKENSIESKINIKDFTTNVDDKDSKQTTQEEFHEHVPNTNMDEYITVFKIVSNVTDIPKDDGSEKSTDFDDQIESTLLFKDLPDEDETEDSTIPEIKENETAECDKNKLNSYYKKCKNALRGSKKITKFYSKADKNTNEAAKSFKGGSKIEEGEKELCDDCNKDTKKSILVSSTNDVKYCLKCSSIFDLDQCNYCLRKEREIQNELTEPTELYSELKEINENVKDV